MRGVAENLRNPLFIAPPEVKDGPFEETDLELDPEVDIAMNRLLERYQISSDYKRRTRIQSIL